MRKFEVWEEGYQMNSQRDCANKLGEYEAETFEEAIKLYLNENPKIREYYNPKGPSIWGCRLYDNETDARKTFG